MKIILFVMLATSGVMAPITGAPDKQLMRELRSGDWEIRSAAVNKAAANAAYVNNPLVQTRLISILERESSDPKWSGREEYSAYEEYYEALGNVVKAIADKTQRSDAWRAVVQSNFGERSRWARDIEESAESLPYLIEATRDRYEVVQGRSAYMLADELSRCKGTDGKGKCGKVLQKSATILAILRRAALQSQRQGQQLGAVEGLGLCGEAQDIALLKQLGRSDPDRAFNVFIDQACKQIQAREQESASRLGKGDNKHSEQFH